MSAATLTTAHDLWRLPRSQHCELVRGEVHNTSPAGFEHGAITMRLARRIANFVESNKLGLVPAAETGFILARNPDTVRAPDISFIAAHRLPAELPEGYWPGAPDLAVETVAPNDMMNAIDEKIEDYLNAGTALIWIVNPRNRTVTIYKPGTLPAILAEDGILDGANIIVGFICPVRDVLTMT